MDVTAWLESQTAAQFLFWFVATVSLIAIVAKSWGAISGFVIAVNSITELAEFMIHTRDELSTIKHEVLPNFINNFFQFVNFFQFSAQQSFSLLLNYFFFLDN